MNSFPHIFLILLFVSICYFIWMDVALYYKIQSATQNLLLTINYNEKRNNEPSKKLEKQEDLSFDPFKPISVKLLMLDHLNHYVFYPLVWWLDSYVFKIAEVHTFITPDMISMSQVFVSMIGCRLISDESLTKRRIGVLLYQLRSLLDSYDGFIARARYHLPGMVQRGGTWGFWLDGTCDAIGTVFILWGSWILLYRHSIGRKYVRRWRKKSIKKEGDEVVLEEEEPFLGFGGKNEDSVDSKNLYYPFRYCTLLVFSILCQEFFSSLFWNRYMQNYNLILEVPTSDPSTEIQQLNHFRSAAFWMITWSWRILNPHSLLEIVLCSIYFDKIFQLFSRLQYYGYIPLIALIISSEIHLKTLGGARISI